MPELVELTANEIRDAHAGGCPDCVAAGTEWVHLRICLTCQHPGCCDDSPQTHARKHWQASGHDVIQSLEPGESWRWNFETDQEVLARG